MTNITKHTPGPLFSYEAYRDSKIGIWLCQVTKSGVPFGTAYGATKKIAEANARLIAAAPELLSALKKAREQTAENITEDFFMPYDKDAGETAESYLAENFDNAIAKAEGN
jgi:hypothetical protein